MVITPSPSEDWESFPWNSMRVLYAVSLGNHRFEEIQVFTGRARNLLTDILNRSVADELFEKRQYSTKPKRFEYHLTEKGHDALTILNSIQEWVDRYRPDEV